MSRSRNSNQLPADEEQQQSEAPPSRCVRFLYFTWKFCTCVFSHVLLVSLVVSYCILGAFTFEHLEADNERKVCALWFGWPVRALRTFGFECVGVSREVARGRVWVLLNVSLRFCLLWVSFIAFSRCSICVNIYLD